MTNASELRPRPELLTARQVEAFRNVVASGSVSGAARSMNISQPAVSRMIREMEAALGLGLFIRRGPKIILTPVSEQLAIEVDRYYLGLDHIRDHARRLRRFPSGQLRIASMLALSQGFLAQLSQRFLEIEPDLSLSIHSDTSVGIIGQLRRGEHHIGLCSSVGRMDGSLLETSLPSTSAVCILPTDHKLTGNKEIHPEDLGGESFIALGKSSLLRRQISQIFNTTRRAPVIRHETLYSSTALAMVKAGLGISIVDPYCLMGDSQQDVEVRPFLPAINYRFSILIPEQFADMREISAFRTLVQDHMSRFSAETE